MDHAFSSRSAAMKRPIELKISLGVLACEYMVITTIYIAAWRSQLSTGQPLAPAMLWKYLGFIAIRPLVLYGLWRGIRWIRTVYLWLLPIALLSSVITASRHPATPSLAMKTHISFEMMVDAIGLLALLLLYSPRVGAWFRSASSKVVARGIPGPAIE